MTARAGDRTIIRRERKDRFTVVDNRPVEDEKLSYEALGLLTYLLSRPDNWEVRVDQLKGRGGIGKHKIRRIIGDLTAAGYMKHERFRDPTTHAFTGARYTVFDEPQREKSSTPVLGEGATTRFKERGHVPDSHDVAQPEAENGNVYKELNLTKDLDSPKETRERAREREEGRPSLTFLPPDDGPREIAFQRFLKPRSEGGFPPEAIDDVERARSAWGNVPESEWDDAVEAIPRFLHARKTTGRGVLIGLEKYIRDSHWRRFPKPARSEARQATDSAMVMAYSRGAWALFARKFVERRAVDTALQWIRNGVTVPLATVPTEAEEAALFPIAVASEAFTAWSEHCERLGFTLPKPDVAEFVFLPSREPPELSLRWKGYRLPNLTGIRFGTPRWWWRVYQANAPVSELIKRARTMEGVDQIEMGPLPLSREAAAMVEVRPLTDAWESWANWFSVMHGTHLEFWAKGSIWCPTEYAPAAMSARQTVGATA